MPFYIFSLSLSELTTDFSRKNRSCKKSPFPSAWFFLIFFCYCAVFSVILSVFCPLFCLCHQSATSVRSPQVLGIHGFWQHRRRRKLNFCYQTSEFLLPKPFQTPQKCSISNAFRRSIFPGKGLGAGLKVLKAAANKSSFKALPRKI